MHDHLFDCCTDRHGRPKKRYPTEQAAKEVATWAREHHGASLRVYPCECQSGFHLTGRPAQMEDRGYPYPCVGVEDRGRT